MNKNKSKYSYVIDKKIYKVSKDVVFQAPEGRHHLINYIYGQHMADYSFLIKKNKKEYLDIGLKYANTIGAEKTISENSFKIVFPDKLEEQVITVYANRYNIFKKRENVIHLIKVALTNYFSSKKDWIIQLSADNPSSNCFKKTVLEELYDSMALKYIDTIEKHCTIVVKQN